MLPAPARNFKAVFETIPFAAPPQLLAHRGCWVGRGKMFFSLVGIFLFWWATGSSTHSAVVCGGEGYGGYSLSIEVAQFRRGF